MGYGLYRDTILPGMGEVAGKAVEDVIGFVDGDVEWVGGEIPSIGVIAFRGG